MAAFPDAGLEAYPTGDVLEAARAAVLDAIAALRLALRNLAAALRAAGAAMDRLK